MLAGENRGQIEAALSKVQAEAEAARRAYEAAVQKIADIAENGVVPSQEPPVRVGINSRAKLPPTQDPALVTPAGMTVLQAGNSQALDDWRAGRREGLVEDESRGPQTAADVVREQIQREVADQAFCEVHPQKSPGDLAFEKCYPEITAPK